MKEQVVDLEQLGQSDIGLVGGKNASLGEMLSQLGDASIRVPRGFATVTDAYRAHLRQGGLKTRITERLAGVDVNELNQLSEAGHDIRSWIMQLSLPAPLEAAVRSAYKALGNGDELAVAVRSSATAEDLPQASFAGQQETFLNVRGIDNVLRSIRKVFASLYNDRAIAYRHHQDFADADLAISAGIQQMVRSDTGSSGVLFTLDTESGFSDVVFITASLGLGECIVQGAVNPDEFYVYKPALAAGRPAILRRTLGEKALKMIYADGTEATTQVIATTNSERENFSLNDEDILALAKMAVKIEQHFGRPMDVEWAKDGTSGDLFILQARPETVISSRSANQTIERYHLHAKGNLLASGRSIGNRIGAGRCRVIEKVSQLGDVRAGDVLVTDMTDPDWEPVMKLAAAIVTNRGGRTCHAAIIARELGVPAVVGCGTATSKLIDGDDITVSCAEGDTGFIYAGLQDFTVENIDLETMPALPFKISLNIGNPDRAFSFQKLPHSGVGLARLEFIINNTIGIHPRAILEYENMPQNLQQKISQAAAGYPNAVEFFVRKLSEGVATITAAFAPEPVIVRLSDFKSNEYANMLGGESFEPREENPMLGFRGASRYLQAEFRTCFDLECRALKAVRDDMGLTNLWVMVPFVRTLDEAEQVIALLADNGLVRGNNGLKVIMMCEVPSNAILAPQFLQHFDGFSIGSNDLTQLTLGLDRDSAVISHLFDERDDAVKALLKQAITACRDAGKYVGICGQGPSDYPDFARWLVHQGIDSISLNPDTVIDTWLFLAGLEA
ncbi:MAG: phosphoenolpyruvate synthase [Pseudomonadota bacterium]|nr:phosphoenolpyruvate synthase [Pseudomonadota bacterium]